ncbi:hypothetical protein [Geobacter sp. DSM 9736]|uniref:hypothetical protein n=1 Tax=Geobacter sp. DSM 9736 TaxID=1277350 RepID=UPI000B514A60|nr:hypothetical protein [Geobacter sp. DSM 9736]SNB46916.1 hypothetical protein SAMN06269301_2388 [Geobacter sp. DSM 9736]
MATGYDFRKLRRLIMIHTVVQIFFFVLLIFMAVNFQETFRAKGMPQVFLNSIIATVLIQLAIFYPIKKAAGREVEREITASAAGLTPEQLKELRKKRVFSDFIKTSIFIFFFTFIAKAPPATFVLSTTFFTFAVTALTYFQCFNFAARRAIRERS